MTPSAAQAAPVFRAVHSVTGVDPAALASPSRRRNVCDARAIAAWHLYRTGLTLAAVGQMLGRNHTTVRSMIETYSYLRECDPDFRRDAEAVAQQLTTTHT